MISVPQRAGACFFPDLCNMGIFGISMNVIQKVSSGLLHLKGEVVVCLQRWAPRALSTSGRVSWLKLRLRQPRTGRGSRWCLHFRVGSFNQGAFFFFFKRCDKGFPRSRIEVTEGIKHNLFYPQNFTLRICVWDDFVVWPWIFAVVWLCFHSPFSTVVTAVSHCIVRRQHRLSLNMERSWAQDVVGMKILCCGVVIKRGPVGDCQCRTATLICTLV